MTVLIPKTPNQTLIDENLYIFKSKLISGTVSLSSEGHI